MSRTRGELVALGVVLVGCGAAPLPDGAPLRFEACGEVECAQTRVPLDWSCAEGRCETPAVQLTVRRLRAPAPSRGQLWALDGGPGFAGDAFFDPRFVALVHDAGYDLYVPSHRGTPGSSPLRCAEAEQSDSEGGGQVVDAELSECAAALRGRWGDLTHFGSVAAGRDVAHLLEGTPRSERVVLYGGSYGTLWAQRVLQAAPEAVDLAWLDSVVDLEATLENADAHADAAARALFAQCEASGHCPIDLARVEAVLDRDDVCGASADELRALGYRLLEGAVQERLVYPHVLAAAKRCEAGDRAAVAHALSRLSAPAPPGPSLRYAPLLNLQIIAAELDGGERPSPASALIASRGGDARLRARLDAWEGRAAPNPVDTTSRARMVLWSGALDPLDPPVWAERTRDRWHAELFRIETAGHSVLNYTRTREGHCGLSILQALLDDPDAPIDRACLDDVEPIDWALAHEATRDVVRDWLGP